MSYTPPSSQSTAASSPNFPRDGRQPQNYADPKYVVDLPVPVKVLERSKYRDEDEFTKMRYTACTSDADNFASAGYTLRQIEFGRTVEMFIVVTMYNEDDGLFCKTMLSLYKNIAYLCNSQSSKWGQQGWKKIVICIVADGRTKINEQVLNVLGLMGVYQDGLAKPEIHGQDVVSHIFEFTSQTVVDEKQEILGHQEGFVPVQILFCMKEKNAKKINSHRWFLNAFGKVLWPEVCVLIDVGTKPTNESLYHLWKEFERDPKVAGACGEIYAELDYCGKNLLNPLVASQNFEYKMSNILDKPLESSFGFISVLPGAFSAYRFKALLGRPLESYLEGEKIHTGKDLFSKNMYLAEDRILCFELVTKEGEAWILRYVKAARAETDVPNTVHEFIYQRRRWLNGSFFAGVHALRKWLCIFRSGHSFMRKIAFMFQFLYNAVSLAFSWFSVANFYLTFFFLGEDVVLTTERKQNGTLTGSNGSKYLLVTDPVSGKTYNAPVPFDPLGNRPELIFFILRHVYILAICLVFICSLGNRPHGSRKTYIAAMCLFAIIMGIMLYLGVSELSSIVTLAQPGRNKVGDLIKSYPAFRDLVVSLGSTYGLYILSSVLYLDPWHCIHSFLQYLFLLPSYVNILMVYAFCNLHDVSWGTKGDNNDKHGNQSSSSTKSGDQTPDISTRTDTNTQYDMFERKFRAPRQEKNSIPKEIDQEDAFKNYRTSVILWWLFSNGVMIMVISSELLRPKIFSLFGVSPTSETNPYLKFIFFSVFGFAVIRFAGCVMFLTRTLAISMCG
ncbi:Chitin synthase, class 2 [Phlyctochytrium planicorne]|nr:Chitin synthase, class 2 [Phlyctochytrium planicorne]